MDRRTPRVVIERELAAGARVPLDDALSRYLRGVLRLDDGDAVMVLDGAGQAFAATVAGAELRLGGVASAAEADLAPPAALRIEILQALAKGDRFDDVVRRATELGAWRIVPVVTARTVRRPAASAAAARADRWRRIAREAARQCRRSDVPAVDDPRPLDEALAAARGALRLVLHEGERVHRLRDWLPDWLVPGAADPSVTIAVGPEGGFTDAEVAAARAHGFRVAGLGPRVLRTETVALAACAVLQHLFGDLG